VRKSNTICAVNERSACLNRSFEAVHDLKRYMRCPQSCSKFLCADSVSFTQTRVTGYILANCCNRCCTEVGASCSFEVGVSPPDHALGGKAGLGGGRAGLVWKIIKTCFYSSTNTSVFSGTL